jgi:YD repeat-containing protein
MMDPLGAVATFTYDSARLSQLLAEGACTRTNFTYDAEACRDWRDASAPNITRTTYVYDPQSSRLLRRRDPLSRVVTYTFANDGTGRWWIERPSSAGPDEG